MRTLIPSLFLVVSSIVGISAPARNIPLAITWTEDPRTSATFAWEREVTGRSRIQYGLTTSYTHSISGPEGYRRHVVTVRGLQAGQTYHYRATSTDGFDSGDSTFRTSPGPTGTYHAVIVADTQQPFTGDPAVNHSGVVGEIMNHNPDLYMIAGDIVYEGGNWNHWEDWFGRDSNILKRTVFMPIMGNHEIFDTDDPYYWSLFELPNEPANERYYSFDVGNTHYIALNSENNVSGQTNWLTHDLQSAANDTNITWIIAYWHRPPYTVGDKHGPNQHVKTNWCPILSQYDADFVFSGHNHNYERSDVIRDVRYVVCGGGGGDLNPVTGPESYTLAYTTCFHFVSLQFDNDEMHYRAIRSDGLVFDELTFTNEGRIVQVSPAFPLRGESVKISYDASQGPLYYSSAVHLHLGVDEFSSAVVDAAMTYNSATGRWEYEMTVPTNATRRLAWVFHDDAGTNWHNNFEYNWQAVLGRVRFLPVRPDAGSSVVIRYEGALGPLSGQSPIVARIDFNGWRSSARADVVMSEVQDKVWEATVSVPDYATQMDVAFHGGWQWDRNNGSYWHVPVSGATAAERRGALPMIVPGSPVVSDDPAVSADQNNVGDNFDFDLSGTALRSSDASEGFGDFGEVYFNYDATNLYVGGIGTDPGGSNNVLILFLGLDTLDDNAWNLWHKSSLPNTLDVLHNVTFSEPMDIAIVIGHEYGDGPAYTNFVYDGYDFGQGVYYLSVYPEFTPMTAARISQYDGTNSTPAASTDDDGNPLTDRWEVAMPWWPDLGASNGIEQIMNILVVGVIASKSTEGVDRYISSTYIGRRADGGKNSADQFGYSLVSYLPAKVHLRRGDYDNDGLPNGWEHDHFGTLDGPPPDVDTDGDGLDNGDEFRAGTHPTNGASVFVAGVVEASAQKMIITWPSASNRTYAIHRALGFQAGFQELATNIPASPSINTYTDQVESLEKGYYAIEVEE
ncbi:MAG: metallophosphoesterase [Verrucomicrobia bacterium]|nr:metallophosphoesterase [Verrucomicrobiota bacterium]